MTDFAVLRHRLPDHRGPAAGRRGHRRHRRIRRPRRRQLRGAVGARGRHRDSIRRGHPALAGLAFADSWYGPIDRTRSGLPLFGRFPRNPSILYGYGFSGNGIATTPIGGRILASLALDERDEWSGCGLVRPVEPWMPPEPVRYHRRAPGSRRGQAQGSPRLSRPRAGADRPPARRAGAGRHHHVARHQAID